MPFDGPSGYVAGLQTLARIIAPPVLRSISAWADEHRRLSSKSSAEPGQWRNERIPFLAAVMDALDARHPAPIVVFVASSQVGKSECGLNWIGSTVHQAPQPFLALFPTDKVARKWVRTKLDPMIAESRVLRGLIPLGRRANAGNTLSEKHYPGGVLMTGSANISDDVAMVSVANLLLEEVDRMPPVLEGEGDPVELALRRLATFARSKAFVNSTPTDADTSRIWPLWLSSTMDRFYVPCPHCGHAQYLRFAQLKWTPGKPSGAVYECEHEDCAKSIEEGRHKTEMLAGGSWCSTHPERETDVKGFHVNGLYTPIGLGDSWAKHAAAYERAKGSQARLQVFANTRLGEVHKGEKIKVEWQQVQRRAQPYKLLTIPPGVLTLTSGTDVQLDRLETQILGFGRNERITVIDKVVHPGDTTKLDDPCWKALDDYLAQEIDNAFGVKMRIACSMIDAGYLPDVVLGFTRSRKARHIFACRGSTVATRAAIGKPSYPDVKKFGGKTDNRRFGAELYVLGVSTLKHWLYECLRSDAGDPDDDGPALPATIANWHITFSKALEEDYFRQLTAETFDPKHGGWIARANYHRNEALDTFNYARAASMHHSVAVHRMREADYVRLEQLYQPADARPVKVDAGAAGTVPIRTRSGFFPTRATTRTTEL